MYNKPMGITYQIGYCGNAFRVDTYKGCDFGCEYCFTKGNSYDNKRNFKLANMNFIKNNFRKAFDTDEEYDDIIVEMLRHRVPLHLGGMSDPFQKRENEHRITYEFLELTKRYNYPVIMSTKTANLDDEYFDILDPNIHAFQISLIGTDENWIRNFEKNTPSPQERIEFIKKLKSKGFWVSVRIQPLIDLEQAKNVVKELSHIVDYITVEHLKVYNRKGVKEEMLGFIGLNWSNYRYVGKKYELDTEIKKRNIEELKKISKCPIGCGDNDLHELSDSNNCCGVDTINDNFNGWIRYNSMYINKTGDGTQWYPKSLRGSNLNTKLGNNRLDYKEYVDTYMKNNGYIIPSCDECCLKNECIE